MFEPNDDEKKKDEEGDEDDELDEGLDDEDDDEEPSDDDDEEGEEDEKEGDDEKDEDEDDEKDVPDYQESDLEDPEKRKKFLKEFNESKSAIVQRAIWRKRAKKLGWGKEQERNPPAKPPAKSKKDGSSEVEEAKNLNELTNFRLDHPDLPRLMVKEVETYARAAGISLEQAMKRPLIKRFVRDKKLKERLSNASASSKHRSPQSKTAIDWDTATPEQVAAHRAEIARRAANKR